MQRIRVLGSVLMLLASADSASAIDVPPAGATGCSGCHPMTRWTGSPVPRLTGRRPAEIVTAMQEFRAGKRPGTIMDRIARGFTDDEIKAIAAWYAAQKE
jgi:sulfide dehydrogenase cytochrome subunit